MGESVFSLRKKPPRLTKGVPAFSFPSRRLSSGRRKCSRADCASRVLPLRAWASSRRVVFASAPPVSHPFIFAAGSSFVFRSVAAGVMVCPRSGSRRA